MINKKTNFRYLTLLSLVSSSLLATNHLVSLDEAIDIALQNNAKLKISQTEIEIADAMYNQAMSANYPRLDLEIKAIRMDEAPVFEMRGSTSVDNTQTQTLYNQIGQGYNQAATNFAAAGLTEAAASATASSNIYGGVAAAIPATSTLPISMDVQMMGRDNIMSQLSLLYPVYTGGKISAIIKQAGLGKKIAQEGKRRTNSEVIHDVKRYYYGALLAKKLKKISQDTLERMSLVRDLTSKLYQGGSMNVKKTDYLRSKLSVNLLESLNEEIVQKETLAKAALIFAMGMPWSDTVEVSQADFKEPTMDENFNALVENAYKFNPDYTSLKIAIDIYDAKIDEAQSAYLPNVGLIANAQNIYSNYEYGIVNDTNRNSWTIGVGVNWSLFSGMRTVNEVEQSRLEKLKLQQQELLLQDGLALQVKQAFLEMKSSHKQYEILREASQTAQESRDLNTRAYQEDMVETKDVIESQLFESYTLAAYYRSVHDHAVALSNIDFVVGKALEDGLKK